MFFPHQITKGATLALAFGAVAAPAAAAAPIGDTGTPAPLHKAPAVNSVSVAGNPYKVGPLVYSRQDKQFIPSGPSLTATNPGNLAPITGMGETGAAAAFIAAHRLQTQAQTSPVAANPSERFDWGDAGIGAAGGLAIVVLGVGGGLALSQRRSRRTSASAVVTG